MPWIQNPRALNSNPSTRKVYKNRACFAMPCFKTRQERGKKSANRTPSGGFFTPPNSLAKVSSEITFRITSTNTSKLEYSKTAYISSTSLDHTDVFGEIGIQNLQSKFDLLFKVQTTSPEQFLVTPSIGLVAAGGSVQVGVTAVRHHSFRHVPNERFLVLVLTAPTDVAREVLKIRDWSDRKARAEALNKVWRRVTSSKKRQDEIQKFEVRASLRLDEDAKTTTEVPTSASSDIKFHPHHQQMALKRSTDETLTLKDSQCSLAIQAHVDRLQTTVEEFEQRFQHCRRCARRSKWLALLAVLLALVLLSYSFNRRRRDGVFVVTSEAGLPPKIAPLPSQPERSFCYGPTPVLLM